MSLFMQLLKVPPPDDARRAIMALQASEGEDYVERTWARRRTLYLAPIYQAMAKPKRRRKAGERTPVQRADASVGNVTQIKKRR